ncbi:MAG: hypothetical protein U0X73_04570 [Thermoanaerobaculia bacterium]
MDQIVSARNWNSVPGRPAKVGFDRALPSISRLVVRPEDWLDQSAREVTGGWMAIALDGRLVWGISLEIADAARIRLHLENVTLPPGTRMWTYSPLGETRPFGLELLRQEQDIWTPFVRGDVLYLEIALPKEARGASWGFSLGEAAQTIRSLDPEVLTQADSCLQDATCFDESDFSGIGIAREAVAAMLYQQGSSTFACSGGLLNDTGSTHTPYFLTAHHCISSNSVAATLDPTWDFKTTSCGGGSSTGNPGPSGATVLVTDSLAGTPGTDVSLLLLNGLPGGTVGFLGWTATRPGDGAELHRLSHPVNNAGTVIFPQRYTRSRNDQTPSFTCSDIELTDFLYSVNEVGGTSGGSSGSPVMLDGAIVVGQLLGSCGPSGTLDGCGTEEYLLDGAFATSFPLLAPFLSATGCVSDSDTACHLSGRFRVEVTYSTTGQASSPLGVNQTLTRTSGNAQVMSFNGERATSNQASFWFFFDPANFEMGVKMVDACVPPFNAFWVFVSGLTNQSFNVTITDTLHPERVRHYTNPLGSYPQTVGATGTSDGFPCN